ncbi:MAG: Hint domain-containing protein [Tabrizicola sp.]|nr:Hint domain-containing protein [Tabrizicola sp.]
MATIYGGSGGETIQPGTPTTYGSDGTDLIYGFGGADTINSGSFSDTVYGGDGRDTIDAGGDNDVIYGGANADRIYGGLGNDTIFGGTDGGAGDDVIYGGGGFDFVSYSGVAASVTVDLGSSVASGGDGDDDIFDIDGVIGGDNADVITGDGNANWLIGGAGADAIDGGGGNDTIEGGLGNDTLTGGAGTADVVSYANSATAVNANLLSGSATGEGTDALSGFENLTGSNQNDTLTGDANANVIDGGSGSDRIYGGAGNDTAIGGTGADTIYSGTGNDSIDAGSGANLVYGGSGNDIVTGGTDAETVFGGVGNDTIDGGTGSDVIYGGPETGTTGSGAATPLQFNWTDYADEAPLAGGVVQDTGGISVTVTYSGGISGATFSAENTGNSTSVFPNFERDMEIYVAGGEPFNRDSSAEVFRPDDGGADSSSQVQFDFDSVSGSGYQSEVQNLRFRISDVDLSGFTDSVSVRAYDSEGNEIPIVITLGDTTNMSLSGNTVTAVGGSFNPNDAEGSVLYQIAGPVARIVVQYTDLNPGGAQQAIRISDLHFEALPLLDNDSLTGGDGNDTMYGGIGLDTILGNIGDDRIYGGLGNDSIEAGDGADLVFGDDGNDTINFGAGNDTVYGGAGNDLIDDIASSSLAGSNLIFGGSGNDTVWTGDDADTLYGDEGDDFLSGEAGNDFLYGGADNDELFGGTDSDQLYGGIGADSLQGGDAADTLFGEAGADLLIGGTGNDVVDGGDDNDLLGGGIGDDQLYGGTGRDTIYGDAGDDRIYGGAERDTMYGGDGNDVFYVTTGDLNDSINAEFIDGGGTIPTDILTDNDVINLTPYGWERVTINYTGGDPTTESGQILVYAGPGKTNLIGIINFVEIEQIIPCFTLGTRIMTARGEVAVEALCPGDLIQTRDNGLQPLRWVGTRHLGFAELLADPDLQPVRIGQAALGAAGPERMMLVSPQHRVLIEGSRAEMFFGECEVLVPAKHLVGMSDVTRALPKDGVTYVHILFDRHEIVLSDGLWTESFQPAVRTLEGLDADARREVLALFPELARGEAVFPAARLSLKAHEAKVLVSG